MRKAAKQISKEIHPGIIALDMTLAFDATNRPIMSPLEGQFAVFINHEKVHGFLASYESRIREWVEGKGVLAIVVFNSWLQARHATNDWSLKV